MQQVTLGDVGDHIGGACVKPDHGATLQAPSRKRRPPPCARWRHVQMRYRRLDTLRGQRPAHDILFPFGNEGIRGMHQCTPPAMAVMRARGGDPIRRRLKDTRLLHAPVVDHTLDMLVGKGAWHEDPIGHTITAMAEPLDPDLCDGRIAHQDLTTRRASRSATPGQPGPDAAREKRRIPPATGSSPRAAHAACRSAVP